MVHRKDEEMALLDVSVLGEHQSAFEEDAAAAVKALVNKVGALQATKQLLAAADAAAAGGSDGGDDDDEGAEEDGEEEDPEVDNETEADNDETTKSAPVAKRRKT